MSDDEKQFDEVLQSLLPPEEKAKRILPFLRKSTSSVWAKLQSAIFGVPAQPTDADLELAHKRSSGHAAHIVSSSMCGCFFCGARFQPEAISEWTDDGDTALCPQCNIDAVLPDSVCRTDAEMLSAMHRRWFASINSTR